ncbi:MAG TPA: IS3 family transposase, partial [Candidatus Kapabacteria bacterium]|nr:IS3 family transposase [Candidatus Kapabacteria bacterium]
LPVKNISAGDNLINYNFQVEPPNIKWTTDIITFSILSENVYLSSILDYSNDFVISWSICRNPNAN